jgi:putative Holliday junction resolvase
MGRVLGFDVGAKRIGVAETDDLQLIASPVDALSWEDVWVWLAAYLEAYDVETAVVGLAYDLRQRMSDGEPFAQRFAHQLQRKFPELDVQRYDERLTSVMAQQSLIQAGAPKKVRSRKGEIDKISAVLILQSYLQRKKISS